MNRLSDTHPNAARVQLELMRAAGHERRSELMNQYSQELIRASRLRLLQKHQGNELEAKLEWVKLQYGTDLEQKVRSYLVGRVDVDVLGVTNNVMGILEQIGVRCRIIGSVASCKLGTLRAIFAADILAELKHEHVSALKSRLEATFFLDEELILEAIEHRSSFNLIHLETMLKVDVFISKNRPYDQIRLGRAFKDDPRYITAEDSVLGKLEWYRAGDETSERQWNDILGLIRVQQDQLDLEYARRWATEINVLDLLEKAVKEA
jgi:hypothetical protein